MTTMLHKFCFGLELHKVVKMLNITKLLLITETFVIVLEFKFGVSCKSVVENV
jgi:hypothetical protein